MTSLVRAVEAARFLVVLIHMIQVCVYCQALLDIACPCSFTLFSVTDTQNYLVCVCGGGGLLLERAVREEASCFVCVFPFSRKLWSLWHFECNDCTYLCT